MLLSVRCLLLKKGKCNYEITENNNFNCTNDMYKLERIYYKNLEPKQKEIFNYQKVAGLLADFGFNCIKLGDDWQGADFLADHKNGKVTLRVQLKSRLTINKNYIDKGLYLTFPIREKWYLIFHDELIKKVGKNSTYLNTATWQIGGHYHTESPNTDLLESLEENEIKFEKGNLG